MSNKIIPQGKYVPATRAGSLIFTAGMTPRVNGLLVMVGKVRASQPPEYYRDAVRQAAADSLLAAGTALAEGESVKRVLYMTVFLNTEEDYTTQATIADFASEYLIEKLGDGGLCARTAIGVKTLPGNSPVEIQMIVSVE